MSNSVASNMSNSVAYANSDELIIREFRKAFPPGGDHGFQLDCEDLDGAGHWWMHVYVRSGSPVLWLVVHPVEEDNFIGLRQPKYNWAAYRQNPYPSNHLSSVGDAIEPPAGLTPVWEIPGLSSQRIALALITTVMDILNKGIDDGDNKGRNAEAVQL